MKESVKVWFSSRSFKLFRFGVIVLKGSSEFLSLNFKAENTQENHPVIQRVPINIVHGEIADFLKHRLDYQTKFYSRFKPMVLFIVGEKIKKNSLCKPVVPLIW